MTGPMQALIWTGGTDVTVEERPRPQAGDGQVLVDVAYCGLCGTDLHICAGEHPRARPGIVLGHEIAGRLHHDAGGLAAAGLRPGALLDGDLGAAGPDQGPHRAGHGSSLVRGGAVA